ncbi:MAG: hypothetical protein WCG95_00735 [bacterium]
MLSVNSVKSQSTTNPTFQANPKSFLKQLKAAGGRIDTRLIKAPNCPSHPDKGKYVSFLMKGDEQLWGSWWDNICYLTDFKASPLRGMVGVTKKDSLQALLKRIKDTYPEEGKISKGSPNGYNLLMEYKA